MVTAYLQAANCNSSNKFMLVSVTDEIRNDGTGNNKLALFFIILTNLIYGLYKETLYVCVCAYVHCNL
jgi:hypothetical protein